MKVLATANLQKQIARLDAAFARIAACAGAPMEKTLSGAAAQERTEED
jgi:hypothetical protein